MTTDSASPSRRLYGIGAVARLTGVSPATLRAWERRYGAVETARSESGGRRLYDENDVERLCLIKRLVDRGHAVSHVARLSAAELVARVERADRTAGTEAASPLKVVFLGDGLAALAARLPREDLEVLGVWSGPAPRPEGGVDVAVHCLDGAYEDTRERVLAANAAAGARAGVVVYRYGNRASIARLSSPPLAAMPEPADPDALADACRRAAGRSPPALPRSPAGETPPRRYTTAELERLAAMPTGVECECPRHLARLIGGLSAFEAYSAGCEDRHAEDAALHAYLRERTAVAREAMEDALAELVRVEGLAPG